MLSLETHQGVDDAISGRLVAGRMGGKRESCFTTQAPGTLGWKLAFKSASWSGPAPQGLLSREVWVGARALASS